MEIGKVPNEVLEKIVFSTIKYKRKEVLVSSAIGEDNGIIDFGEDVCVVSTDPITGATKDIGSLSIHISCNDVSTSGAEPIAVLLTILCPPKTTEEELQQIMEDASLAAAELNVEIMGGHTEVTDAVNKVVISTTVIGMQKKDKLPDHASIKAGDKVAITKYIGIEGSSIIAKELEKQLSEILGPDKVSQAKSLDKYLSVVKEGIIAGKYKAKYMHDITEGGVYGALWEASIATKKGILIHEDKIPILDITKDICQLLKIDPYRLISSGSMVIIIGDEDFNRLSTDLKANGINITAIGEITENGVYYVRNEAKYEILPPGSDELYRALSNFS
ncbi:AIR synthase [Tissierella creatinini]|nr:AIR synthase [Tissierella creatinini]TJX62931.1 AIR synthase [Soehngenia saccharolytica]